MNGKVMEASATKADRMYRIRSFVPAPEVLPSTLSEARSIPETRAAPVRSPG
jgi:hypothetical protein